MQSPNVSYFPEPISVPHNAAKALHKERIRFVRRVLMGHCFCMLASSAIAFSQPQTQLLPAVIIFALGSILLTFVRRIQTRITSTTTKATIFKITEVLCLVACVFGFGVIGYQLHEFDISVLSLLPAVVGLLIYTIFCRNDFSYIGAFVICAIFCAILTIPMMMFNFQTKYQAWIGFLYAIAYLFYVVYDMSMIVKRRRLDETRSGILDFYRDTLNFITYAFRVHFHWKRYRFL